jgi:hypothetical protein
MRNRIAVSEIGTIEHCLQVIRVTLGDAMCGGDYVMKHFLDWFESGGPDAGIFEVAMVGTTLFASCGCPGRGDETAVFFQNEKGAEEGVGFVVIPGHGVFQLA